MDPAYRSIAVILNARPAPSDLPWPPGTVGRLELHPVLAESADPRQRDVRVMPDSRRIEVPAWTATVLVERWGAGPAAPGLYQL